MTCRKIAVVGPRRPASFELSRLAPMTRATAFATSAVLLAAFAVLTALFAVFRPGVLAPEARGSEIAAIQAARETALLTHMLRYQRFVEKASAAVEAGNAPLAAFYGHEIEEVTERLVGEQQAHDGTDLSAIAAEVMLPRAGRLVEAARAGDRAATDAALGEVIDGCNACHRRSGHRWIVIQRPISASGAYPSQSFAPVR